MIAVAAIGIVSAVLLGLCILGAVEKLRGTVERLAKAGELQVIVLERRAKATERLALASERVALALERQTLASEYLVRAMGGVSVPVTVVSPEPKRAQ